ncbi:MAG: sll1863 family stress response protein [Nitrospirota bacterium]
MRTKKDEYIDKMAKQLKEWSARIDELESRAAGASADVKTGYETTIRELKEKREALSIKLREVGQASGEAWISLRSGVETAWKDLRHAVSSAKDKFKKAA